MKENLETKPAIDHPLTADSVGSRKAIHWPLVILLAVFALLAFSYNLVLPLGEISDSRAHFALIRFIAEHNRPPLTLEERTSVGIKGDASPLYHSIVAVLTQHVDISVFPELPYIDLKGERAIPDDRRITRDILHTEDELFPFKGIVLAYHLAGLVSIPMGAATIIAVYLTVLAIYPKRRYFALAAAAFVAFLPRFIISSAVVNDDNLVFPLIAFSIYLLVRIIQGDEQYRTFFALGVLIGLAVITKYHSLILVPEMTLVLLVMAWIKGWGWPITLRRWGLTMFTLTLTSGWWLAFVLIRFNDINASGLVSGLLASFGDPVLTVGSTYLLSPDFNPISIGEFDPWASWTFRSFWMHYNGVYTGMQAIGREGIYWTTFWILGAFCLVSVLGLVKKGGTTIYLFSKYLKLLKTWRLDVTLLGIHFLIYLGLALLRYMLFPAWSTSQGRHLYPALTSLAFFFTLGLSEVLSIFQRRWPQSGDKIIVVSIAGPLLAFSILTLPVFIFPVYYPYLPIVTMHPDGANISHRLAVKYADDLRFEGYDLVQPQITGGEALPVTLYWRARKKQERDYLVRVCLRDQANQVITCHLAHPVDGRYPTRAWEVGYLIRDELYLPVPACLLPGTYNLTLSVLPLRLDTAQTVLDETVGVKDPISLGAVTLSAAAQNRPAGFEVWVGDNVYRRGEFSLWQIRQTMTVLNYGASVNSPAGATREISLVSANNESGVNPPWRPVTPAYVYPCPAGSFVSTQNFLVHPGVRPGVYRFAQDSKARNEPLVRVITRSRNFSPPPEIDHVLNASFAGEFKLLGYEVDLSPRLPGNRIRIKTYWQALRTMGHSHVGSIHLLDNTIAMWGQIDEVLGGGYPNVLWAPGEVVEEVYDLPVNDYVAAGQYTIKLGVYDLNQGKFDFLLATTQASSEPVKDIQLGQVRVMDPARAEPPPHPMRITLGEEIHLLGYDINSTYLSTNSPLRLALHWEAFHPPATDYTVFTQLVGPDGLVWGQSDSQPQGGSYPTTAWAIADRVVDRYELSLSSEAPPGQYRLLVGMYDLASGQRLPAFDEQGQRLPNDAIELADLTLIAEQ